jgi:hypothetical protein
VEQALRQARGRAPAGSWQWARTAATRRALLDAAREAFTEQGFAEANITGSSMLAARPPALGCPRGVDAGHCRSRISF